MAKQDFIAMLLAGGQGSRLGVLTANLAKPAVPFGSRYRLIDFPLSNCTNSGIETVGVLTQYMPLELNEYVGNGHSWDLDRNSGGLSILSPYQRSSGSDWFRGTANSIYQNMHFIERYSPKYVLILSGDHIYKMNYSQMLEEHIAKGADVSIAVIEVPWEETNRFGIMNTDDALNIIEFEEKPEHAKNNLASMGIYIFDWPILQQYLIQDEEDAHSSNDFGKDIIPSMLENGCRMVAYPFEGYWKDVGTVYSLWEANMDLLDDQASLNLRDSSWRIFTRNPIRPPHYVGERAIVEECFLTDGDKIYGSVYHSVVGDSVIVEEGAIVRDSVLMPGCHIKAGAVLDRCIVGIDTIIGENVVAGKNAHHPSEEFVHHLCTQGISVFQNGMEVEENQHFAPNSMVRELENPRSNRLHHLLLKRKGGHGHVK